MTLNLWLLKEWLDEFSPSIHCSRPKQTFTGLRLYRTGMECEEYTLYAGRSDDFFQDGDAGVVCMNRSDYLCLETEDLLAVVNSIQDAFHYYAVWYNGCVRTISEGGTLSDLLACAAEVFSAPIMIVDAAQIVIAQSADLTTVIAPEDRDNILTHKSIPEEKLKQFNQTYKDSFYSTGIITIPAGFFPTKSYCKQIYINEERFGTLILKSLEGECSPGRLYLLELLEKLVRDWIQATEENTSFLRPTSYFSGTLGGKPGSLQILGRQLNLFDWESDCKKQLYVVSATSGPVQFDVHINQRLANDGLGIYATLYRNRLVILCNLDLADAEAFRANLDGFMKEKQYCGASSFFFTDLSQLLKFYDQTLTALEHSPRAPGKLYRCQDVAMRMVARIVDDYTTGSLLHPAIAAIREYDSQHKTEYYQTLFTYLKNERRQQQTAEELFIHRNTLFLRLDKIHTLWPLDLEDAEERFYILFSFYQDQYAGKAAARRLMQS